MTHFSVQIEINSLLKWVLIVSFLIVSGLSEFDLCYETTVLQECCGDLSDWSEYTATLEGFICRDLVSPLCSNETFVGDIPFDSEIDLYADDRPNTFCYCNYTVTSCQYNASIDRIDITNDSINDIALVWDECCEDMSQVTARCNYTMDINECYENGSISVGCNGYGYDDIDTLCDLSLPHGNYSARRMLSASTQIDWWWDALINDVGASCWCQYIVDLSLEETSATPTTRIPTVSPTDRPSVSPTLDMDEPFFAVYLGTFEIISSNNETYLCAYDWRDMFNELFEESVTGGVFIDEKSNDTSCIGNHQNDGYTAIILIEARWRDRDEFEPIYGKMDRLDDEVFEYGPPNLVSVQILEESLDCPECDNLEANADDSMAGFSLSIPGPFSLVVPSFLAMFFYCLL